ncbi:MAG: hypothetical protein HOO67_00540 [Candidatus Peribacteraceae bacterium]|nr:hypothetical protein [Candidatus Peribacteraceae bacterium]
MNTVQAEIKKAESPTYLADSRIQILHAEVQRLAKVRSEIRKGILWLQRQLNHMDRIIVNSGSEHTSDRRLFEAKLQEYTGFLDRCEQSISRVYMLLVQEKLGSETKEFHPAGVLS